MSKLISSPRWLVSFAAVALCIASVGVFGKQIPVERVQVAWAPEQQLTEVKDNQFHRGWLRPKDWMASLSEHLQRRADAILPAGEKLEVTIDDIKLAGDFEPWHGAAAEDIRFMKDIYPPRIDLHYRLLDADGRTLREGSGKLRDLSYLQRVVPNNTDPLRYDKRLLDDWLRKEFRAGEARAMAPAQRGA